MLTVLEFLRAHSDLQFTAIAPPTGSLADRLAKLNIPHVAYSVRNDRNIKRDTDELLKDLCSILEALKPHILHANSLSMARLIGQLLSTPQMPARTGHLRDIIRLNKKVISDLNQNDRLVAVSQATKDFHVSQGLREGGCDAIHNGVDTNRFRRYTETKMDLRRAILPEVPPDSGLLLNVGQICMRKGQLLLAQTVCDLLLSEPNLQLVVAGERYSGKQESREYEASMTQTFQEAGYESHLHMLGYRTDIPDLMNACDLLVHTAHQEPFGRTLLEAAACGLPIVATATGGTSEMIRHRQECLLVDTGALAQTAQAVKCLMSDGNRAASLATAARQRVEQLFSIERAAQKLAIFWHQTLSSFSAE